MDDNNKIFILLYIASVIINLVIWWVMYNDDRGGDDNLSGNYLIATFLPFINIFLVTVFIGQVIFMLIYMVWNVYIKRRMTFKQLMEKEF